MHHCYYTTQTVIQPLKKQNSEHVHMLVCTLCLANKRENPIITHLKIQINPTTHRFEQPDFEQRLETTVSKLNTLQENDIFLPLS